MGREREGKGRYPLLSDFLVTPMETQPYLGVFIGVFHRTGPPQIYGPQTPTVLCRTPIEGHRQTAECERKGV